MGNLLNSLKGNSKCRRQQQQDNDPLAQPPTICVVQQSHWPQYNSEIAYDSRFTTTARPFSSSRNLFSIHSSDLPRKVNLDQCVRESAVPELPLMRSVYNKTDAAEWNMNSLPHNKSYRLVNVLEYEEDFVTISKVFQNGAKRKNLKIFKIERVENPFLLGCYLLKKEEMTRRSNKLNEQRCFHGTKRCNVDSICENNFNWRLYGGSTGSRYGQGVSFSPISFYASHYSDKNATDKVMFYVKVLVSNSTEGNKNMVLPPKLNHVSNVWYDTALKPGGHVVVKFCDNEFYPEFIIHYRISAPTVQYHSWENVYN